MDIRSVIPLSVAAAALALGTGCAGGKFWKDKDSAATAWKVPEGVPTAPLSSAARGESGVVQAGGTMPAASSTTTPAFAWLTGKGDKAGKAAKVPAAVLITAWQNKVEYLPDPSRGGAMGPGLVGQLFLKKS